MKVAALDFGTNTFLLLIAEVNGGRVTQVLHDEVKIVRLGEGVHKNREFGVDALRRADECLQEFHKTIEKHFVKKTRAVATSAARDVKNREAFFEIGRRNSIPIEVISGEKEAQLTYEGMASGLSSTDGVVGVDIGGGSTEIVRKDQHGKVIGHSFDVGCVRLAEMFITRNPVPETESQALREHAKKVFSTFEFKKESIRKVIAVAGTPTTLACLDQNTEFKVEKIDGYVLSRKVIQSWESKLASMSIEERVQLKSLERGRADVIVPGAILLDLCAELLEVDEVTVSTRGIRYGLALEMGKENS